MKRTSAARTPAAAIATLAERIAATAKTLTWPSKRYQTDPIAFFIDVLGVAPWEKQLEIILAIRDHKRVAIASGHKISKSHTAAGLALWFYCSFPDARVVMSSTTSRQVDQILWRELRMMHARAKYPIGGDLHELARSGLKATDFREVVGFTAREAEAVAGISGKNLLYILDEASGIPDIIFEAIEGNRAGGARVALFSNPTRTEGEFFRAFHEKAAFYKTLQVSSEETPNAREGREIIPGLAGREWIEEKKVEWGEDSALYKIRVRGEFVLQEDGKILTVHAIAEAESRWHEASGVGRLCIGLDPAGPGQGGDESVFAVRRADKVLALVALRGVSEDAHLAHLLGILKEHRATREPLPLVLIDREGPIGSRLLGHLRAYADRYPDSFELVGVRSSDRAAREPQIYDRVRDELWANLARWLREGGSIPEDARLAKELHAPEWIGQISGRLKATPKDELRKHLGRSPDRADAVALSIWEPAAYQAAQSDWQDDIDDEPIVHIEIDPYELVDPTGGYS